MITGIQHISYTVSDVQKARDFFVEKLELDATPVRDLSGEEVEKMLGFPGIHMRTANVILSDLSNIELVEYLSPKGKKLDLATCNTGVAHLAFTVDDIEQTYRRLKAKGVRFVNPPQQAKEGRLKGWTISYLRGPDGITLEITEAPKDANLQPDTDPEVRV